MTKQLVKRQHPEPPSAELIEAVLLAGDLSQLSSDQRLSYYKSVCDTLGLNPLTKPFDYITLDGKLVLYARKDCTEQLRKLYNISLTIKSREASDGVYSVVAQAKLPSKRVDEAMGVVPLEIVKDGKTHALTAAAKANNMMKAETKAKRRVTLSICGLGLLDESEIDAMFEYDTQPVGAVIERNVREATANATGEAPEKIVPVTEENYADVVCHVGKAQGNILGRRVGDIHPKIIVWLAENWVPKLAAVPDEKDARLRAAVMLALKKQKITQISETPKTIDEHIKDQEAHETTPKSPPESSEGGKPTQDTGAGDQGATEPSKSASLKWLREKIDDLVMTPVQFMGYLQLAGFNLTTEQKNITDLTDNQLKFLENDWATAKASIEAAVKPKVVEKPAKKRAKMKDPFDD